MSSATYLGVIIGGVAVAGVTGYVISRQHKTTGITITLSETSNSMAAGETQQFTATVSQNGKPANGLKVTLTDLTSKTSASSVVSNGIALFNVTINNPGTYSFQASVQGVTSNKKVLTVTGKQQCPCGQVYSETAGGCIPLVPQEIQWLSNGSAIQSADAKIGYYVYQHYIPVVLGYFLEGVTMKYNPTPSKACPYSSSSKDSQKTLSGTISLQLQAVDNSDTPIGCTKFNLSLNNTSLSVTDASGISWVLSFDIPSSVTANSNGVASVSIQWTLTRSWNGSNLEIGPPPSNADLQFGTLTATASIADSTLSGGVLLDVSSPVCYYGAIGD